MFKSSYIGRHPRNLGLMDEDIDVTFIKAVSLSIGLTIKYSGVSGQFREWHNMVDCVNMVVFLKRLEYICIYTF